MSIPIDKAIKEMETLVLDLKQAKKWGREFVTFVADPHIVAEDKDGDSTTIRATYVVAIPTPNFARITTIIFGATA